MGQPTTTAGAAPGEHRARLRVLRDFVTHPGTWLLPILVVLGVALTVPAVYLGGTINPPGNVRNLPVGLVVEPQTVPVPGGSPAAALADQIAAGVDAHAIALQRVDPDEEARLLGNGSLYGAVRIPADFDAQLAALRSADPGAPVHPVVHLDTNPATGAMVAGLIGGQLSPVLTRVGSELGHRLLEAAPPGSTTAALSALAAPFTVVSAPLEPLPANTGMGTSAFYYAVVLVLLGLVGASAIHPLIDASSGFLPTEIGPIVRRRPYLHLTRLQSLVSKWLIIVVAAPIAAALAQLVAGPVLGMPIDRPLALWLFATSTVAAVGVGALTVFACFGALGPLINMFFFVALAMPSSAGTIPLEAVPGFYRTVARVEPMRPVVAGLRSLLYFDSAPGSGLTGAWWAVGGLAAASVLIGLVTVRAFDRMAASARHPEMNPARAGSAAKHRAGGRVAA